MGGRLPLASPCRLCPVFAMLAGKTGISEGNWVMVNAVIERFQRLDAAFSERASKGERLYGRFSALASISSSETADILAARSFQIRDRLNEGLGTWKSPGRAMRLVFAAALAASNRSADNFFTVRTALNDRRRDRGTRALSHGGSCAALALVVAGGESGQVDNFFDILDEISLPWWRRVPAREDVLAAAFAALGDTPEHARTKLDTARLALRSAGVPGHHVEGAAQEICLGPVDPGELAAAWTSLNTAVRGRPILRNGVGKTGLAVLASRGRGPEIADRLVTSFEAVRALRPRPSGQVAARLAMRLAQAQTGTSEPHAAARDLAAILAAQAAVIAAVAGSTAAVAAAT